MADKITHDHRVGIVPFDIKGDMIAILFVTSQTRGRWILPKGKSKSGESDTAAAKREAFEEAGIKGDILSQFPMTVLIEKTSLDTSERVPVTYYPMRVTQQVDDFPEKKSRERHWALLKDATRVAHHDDYLEIVGQFKQLAGQIKKAVRAKK